MTEEQDHITGYAIPLGDCAWQITEKEKEAIEEKKYLDHPTLGMDITDLLKAGAFYVNPNEKLYMIRIPKTHNFIFT